MDEFKHYYRLDAAGIVIYTFSTAFEQPREADYLVGTGGRHFDPDIKNERGQYILKIVAGGIAERSQQELDDEWAARPPEPETAEQKIARLETDLAAAKESNLNAMDAVFDLYLMVLDMQAGGGGA